MQGKNADDLSSTRILSILAILMMETVTCAVSGQKSHDFLFIQNIPVVNMRSCGQRLLAKVISHSKSP